MWITAFRKPDLTSTACSTRRETTGCSSAASRVARRRSITGRLSKTWSLRRAIQLRRMAHLLCPKRPKWPCRTADPLSGAGCGAQHPRHHQVPLLAHDGREPACRIRLPECGGRVCAGRYQGPLRLHRRRPRGHSGADLKKTRRTSSVFFIVHITAPRSDSGACRDSFFRIQSPMWDSSRYRPCSGCSLCPRRAWRPGG